MTTITDSEKKVWLSKPIGEKLEEAGLISPYQIQVALMDQSCYFQSKFGEILALRGWLKQETADFFAQKIPELVFEPKDIRLGDYLKEAALLEEEQIAEILKEQIKLGIKFGYIAVLKGYVKQETLDFFVKYFVAEKSTKTTFHSNQETLDDNQETMIQFETQIHSLDQEIPWIN